jgi:hypothetical protein
MRLLFILLLPLAVSACALPQSSGPARECIPDTGICYFPDDPNAPTNPYAR